MVEWSIRYFHSINEFKEFNELMAFFGSENENRQLEDLPQADVGFVPERFILSVRTKLITENFVHYKLHPLLFL